MVATYPKQYQLDLTYEPYDKAAQISQMRITIGGQYISVWLTQIQ